MTENEIATKLIDICFNLHNEFGPGLFESVYEELICYELMEEEISFVRQKPIKLRYKNIELDVAFRADIIIENKVILEIKSIETIVPVHKKQVITYLKLADMKLGLLINFNVNLLKEGIFRIVNNIDE